MMHAGSGQEQLEIRVAARGRGQLGPGLLVCLGLSLSVSCADPQYGSEPLVDAATCTVEPCLAKSHDAGAPEPPPGRPDANLPDGAVVDLPISPRTDDDSGTTPAPPKDDPKTPAPAEGGFRTGNYAIRARFYAVEASAGLAGLAQQITMLGQVARDAQSGELTLRVSSCDDHATGGSGPVTTKARMLAPERYPSRVYILQVTGDTFQTVGLPALAGYTAETATTCPPGARVPAPPDQSWRKDSQCTCARDDSTPTSQDDCRVTDSDGDGKPGFTVRWSGAVNRDMFAARRDLSEMSSGKIRRDGRHSAHYRWNHEHSTLACTSGTCSDGLAYRPCVPSVTNPVLFAPLDPLAPSGAPWDCTELMQEASSLFPEDPLAIPSDC